MPNRIIRECSRTSPSLAKLSDLAERTFWRVITVLDDFGRYNGTTNALLAACYPEGAPMLTAARFKGAIAELEEGDLLRFYRVDGREYVYSPTWMKYQRRRASESKFPQPTENKGRGHLTADDRESRTSAAVIEDVVVVEGGGGGDARAGTAPALERPPAPPEYVTSCKNCVAMLRTLNDSSGRCYNAPGRAGEWMHLAHDGRNLSEVLSAIKRQAAKLIRLPGKARFLSPSVLFKPENWDTTINDRPAPADRFDELTPPEGV